MKRSASKKLELEEEDKRHAHNEESHDAAIAFF